MMSAVKNKFLAEEQDEFEQEDFPEMIKEEISEQWNLQILMIFLITLKHEVSI